MPMSFMKVSQFWLWTKEPMSDGGKRNVNFVMTEEVLQCQDQAAWGLLQPKQTN